MSQPNATPEGSRPDEIRQRAKRIYEEEALYRDYYDLSARVKILGQNLLLAASIPTYDLNTQQTIRSKAMGFEVSLLERFGDIIPENRRFEAHNLEFLTTPDFRQVYNENTPPLPAGFSSDKETADKEIAFFCMEMENFILTQGLRTQKDDRIAIHTTEFSLYRPDHPITISKMYDRDLDDMVLTEVNANTLDIKDIPRPRLLPIEEAIMISKHELVHKKTIPQYEYWEGSNIPKSRKTGPKIVEYDQQGNIVGVRHRFLYEQMTDIVTILGDHPEVSNWDEFSQVANLEGGNRGAMLRMVTLLCKKAFNEEGTSFDQQLQLLGQVLFKSEGQMFFERLPNIIKQSSYNDDLEVLVKAAVDLILSDM